MMGLNRFFRDHFGGNLPPSRNGTGSKLGKALVFPFPPARLLAKRAFRLRPAELFGTLLLR
jgi:hypothetical protein